MGIGITLLMVATDDNIVSPGDASWAPQELVLKLHEVTLRGVVVSDRATARNLPCAVSGRVFYDCTKLGLNRAVVAAFETAHAGGRDSIFVFGRKAVLREVEHRAEKALVMRVPIFSSGEEFSLDERWVRRGNVKQPNGATLELFVRR